MFQIVFIHFMVFLYYLGLGAVLGLSAGISPGPLLALVISETLRHGKREGIKIALVPLISDIPIVVVSLIFLSWFARSQMALAVVAILGSVFVAYLGYDCLTSGGLATDTQLSGIKPAGKGILVNILNPHPYLFWITVGAPILFKAWQASIFAVAAFFLSFYLLLVGSKIVVAILVHRSKTFLNNRGYIWIMRALGVALLVFAALFLINGIKIISGI
jgi:threonine/homoserine/homoserine lactone efflux protein